MRRRLMPIMPSTSARWPSFQPSSRVGMAAGPGGRIINLSSGQGVGPMPTELAYAATKGAIEAFTTSLAAGVAPKGITVNAIDPGATDTGWMTEELKAAHPSADGVRATRPARGRRAPDHLSGKRRRRLGLPARRFTRVGRKRLAYARSAYQYASRGCERSSVATMTSSSCAVRSARRVALAGSSQRLCEFLWVGGEVVEFAGARGGRLRGRRGGRSACGRPAAAS